MSLKDTITADMKEAMKAKEAERVSVLRMVLSAFSNEAIALKKKEQGLTEEEELAVLSRQAKQRQEAAAEYAKGGRDEQAAAERREFDIIKVYLPEQLSEEELRTIVQAVIDEVGANSLEDMGRVMGAAMASVQGKADGNAVRAIVEELLSAED